MDKYQIDGHKLYWHLDRLQEWQEKRFIPPIYLEVSPVSYCNHKCIFCGIDFAMQDSLKLDTKLFCKKIHEMAQSGIRSIMYAGEGEPLLHKDLPVFVKTTKENGIDVCITTNGTCGNYELWKEILPCLSWIKFSVDAGSSKVYSKVHNVKEEIFYKTMNSINEAVRVKKKYNLNVTIGVQFLVIEENINDAENAINLFSQSDINYLVFKPYSFHPKMLKEKEVVYTEEKVQFLHDLVNKYVKKTDMDIIFRKNAMVKYMRCEKKYSHCYALPFWGCISPKGDFYTCSIFIGDKQFEAGNIFEHDMKDIIYGEKRKQSIIYAEKELVIKECCRTNCRMARINEFLEFLNNKPEHINFI